MSTIHWAERAACAGTPIDLWFPTAGQAAAALATARRYCAACPVWDDCLTEDLNAHVVGKRYGVRAGLSPTHRDDIAGGTRPRPTQPPPPPLICRATTRPARQGATAVSVTNLDPAPAATPTTNDELIAWGAAHASARVQALAARARAALNELAQLAARDEAVAKAEARVQRLKAQLANAEQDLRAVKNGTAKPQPPAAASNTGRDYAAVRAWARENGFEVGAVGIPKRAVLDAYDAAHAQDAA